MLTSFSSGHVVPGVGVLGEAQPPGHLVPTGGMAGDDVGQLEHARAGEPGEPEDLPLVDVEVDAAQPLAGDLAHLEHHRRLRLRGDRRTVVRVDVLAHHQARERTRVQRGDVVRAHEPAAAQDRHPVGELEDLVHPVRDVEDRRPRLAHLPDDGEQTLDLVVGKHRRGLVEHQQPSAAVPALECGGDRDDRALHRRRRGQRLMDVNVDGEALQQLARHSLLLAPQDPTTEPLGEASMEGEVVLSAELEHEAEVLMDEAQALGHLVPDGEWDAAKVGCRAAVGLVIARQCLDQRRLP